MSTAEQQRIAELEKELAESRVAFRNTYKERDELLASDVGALRALLRELVEATDPLAPSCRLKHMCEGEVSLHVADCRLCRARAAIDAARAALGDDE